MFAPEQPVYVYLSPPAPTIESSRLLLRPVADSDLPGLFALRARPEVAQFNHPKTPFTSIEQTQAWIDSKIFTVGPDDVIGRSFNYSILEKSAPEQEPLLIGYVSINSLDPSPEIGYSIIPEAWGKGYASEALQLMLQMWWELPRREELCTSDAIEKVYAICQRDNHGSCGVLRKCGFTMLEKIQYEEDKLYLWGLEKPAKQPQSSS